ALFPASRHTALSERPSAGGGTARHLLSHTHLAGTECGGGSGADSLIRRVGNTGMCLDLGGTSAGTR
ncbi:hypothetical protein FKM82_024172, partial [Ascaphus truei]